MAKIEKQIGISTHFLPATKGETIFDAIKIVSRAGFKGFEIVPTMDQGQLGYPETIRNVGIDLFEAKQKELEELRKALKVFDWVTVHAPHIDWNLASGNRHLRKLTWKYYDRCMEFAELINARAVSYHMGYMKGFILRREKILNISAKYAEHLLKEVRTRNIPAGFETGAFSDVEYICKKVK
ncbi:MAG: sugar phosphate isomerase/epimerase, partial [Candidatus Omnitrophica bacterium]|nr:sugar phosphate isomerase/epimerase [Candidatus Omnitrophota bacterium]